jgi:hypothetical protein
MHRFYQWIESLYLWNGEVSHPFARKKAKGWGTEHLWGFRRLSIFLSACVW